MPSSPNYKRDYTQEKKTNDKRKGGAKAANKYRAGCNKARSELGLKKGDSQQAGHKTASKSGGSNSVSNFKRQSGKANQSAGGRSGNPKGKAAGARKGHKN